MEGSVVPYVLVSYVSTMSPTVLNVLVPNMTSTLWVFYTCSQNHGVMRKYFFTGWQEEGSDTTELSLICWIQICSTETDVLALGSHTLGVSRCVLVSLS
jgi:hypothetical protein